ncbi:major capsid protein [Gordonia sp. TBRC 11910]|uniref:Major capsid protein n=1 Tax=Gordonia asplenii TaxID=2725283 RepID=A0A848KRU7_9ACTN|nr:major capsid protein [Gordonia asplenii]NMO00819.1 major capsid protein [Gordonia asplenii]
MAITLQELVDLAQAPGDGVDPKAAVAAKVAEAIKAGDDVTGLIAEAQTQFDALDSSEESVATGELLADVVDGITEAQSQVEAADSERAARMSELKARIAPPAPEAEDEEKPEETPEAETPEAATDPAAEPADATPEVAAEPEAVAASSAPQVVRRVVLRDLTPDTSVAPVEHSDQRMSIVASADVPDHAMGQDLKDIRGLTKAAVGVIQSFPEDVKNAFIKKSIAQFRPHYPKELVASGETSDMEVIAHAADHTRLEGGSLVAAGGWCSPSETIYDLAPDLASASAGILSLPEIQISRGGLRYTQGPDFGAVWSGIGFSQTEAQAIAGDAKTVYRVPCPAFQEDRAEIIGAAIEAGILQNDAYPELTERVVALTPAVHEHKLNLKTIAKMVTLSTAVSIEAGPSATLALLNGLDLTVTDVRYQYRAEESLQLEMALPIWAKSHYRSDLAMRDGVPMENVTDANIDSAFASRGVLVHWVYDWQDSFSGVANGWGAGAANAQTSFTNSVKALVYPAGTFVRGRSEVINLSGIYDSTNIRINDFLRLFMEEKWMLIKRQWHSRLVTIPLNVNGATGIGRQLDADGKIVVTP